MWPTAGWNVLLSVRSVLRWTVAGLIFVSPAAVYAAVETQRFQCGGPKQAVPMVFLYSSHFRAADMPVSVTVIAVRLS